MEFSGEQGSGFTDNTKIFRLNPGGESYQAAAALRQALEETAGEGAIGPEDLFNPRRMQERWTGFLKDFHRRMQKGNPGLLQPLGLLDPATLVVTFSQGLPRAYNRYPVAVAHEYARKPHDFADWEHYLDYYVLSPLDYKGEYFTPPDAEELTAYELRALQEGFSAAGPGRMVPVLPLPRNGVPAPADFDPERHRSLKVPAGPELKAFIAGGRSLDVLDSYIGRFSEWRRGCQLAEQQLWAIVRKAILPAIFNDAARGGNFDIALGYALSGEGNTEFFLILQDGAGPGEKERPSFLPREEIGLPENPYFHTLSKGDMQVIIPRGDTPEGRKLQKLFDAVPLPPSLAEFPELHPAGQKPVASLEEGQGAAAGFGINELDGRTILVYPAGVVGEDTFCPPGAKPLSSPLYLWLNADRSDRDQGIVPPPLPGALRHEYADSKKAAVKDVLRSFMLPEPRQGPS